MDFLTNADLTQQLSQTVRSNGLGGLTTAQDLRNFLALVLDELRAEAATSQALTATLATKADLGPDGQLLPNQLPATSDYVHTSGDEIIGGRKTFTGDVVAVTGQVQAASFAGNGAHLTNLPSTPTLLFAFEPDCANFFTATIAGEQAGFYAEQDGRNLARVEYTLNDAVVTLPLTLQVGDILTVRIVRQQAPVSALLTLRARPNQQTVFYSTRSANYVPSRFVRTTGTSGLRTPAISGTVAVAFWLRATNNQQYGSFLVDFRAHGQGYWWNTCEASNLTRSLIDGIPATCYSAVFTPGWHKVYLEFATIDQPFYLLSRFSETEFFFPCDIADITFYNRSFTDVEQADATGPLPTSGVLARYRELDASRTNLVDNTGQQEALVVVGAPVTDTLPRVWFRGESLPQRVIELWPNEGYTASTHDLKADLSARLPTTGFDAQTQRFYARFTGNDWLTTPQNLGLGDVHPFTLVLVFRTHRANARNLLGWGAQQQSQLFDVYAGNQQVVLHTYGMAGPFNEGDNPALPGHWQVLYVSNGQVQVAYLNGMRKSATVDPAQPADSPLRLGAGQWPNLNSDEILDIAECRLYDNVELVEAEREALLAELIQAYTGGVDAIDLPINNPAWQFSMHWGVMTAADRSDIRMPYATAVQDYASGSADNYAELTFRVAGTASEGIRLYGMVEEQSQVDVLLNGVVVQHITNRGNYRDITVTLLELFGLPAGQHVLRLVKSQTWSDSGGRGFSLGGAILFAKS